MAKTDTKGIIYLQLMFIFVNTVIFTIMDRLNIQFELNSDITLIKNINKSAYVTFFATIWYTFYKFLLCDNQKK